jgi:hypothetical protein
MSRRQLAVAAVLAVTMAACGGGSNITSSTTSTTSTTVTSNRAPTVSATANTGFGIQSFTNFSFSSSTADADGDAVTVSWNFGDGTALSGNNVTKVYATGGNFAVIATATDSRGATATSVVNIVVGSMTGNWVNVVAGCGPFNLSLTQTGGTVTGTFLMPANWCNVPGGSTGRTDPAEPGTINAAGVVRIRLKIGIFLDAIFTGTMDGTGRVVNGNMTNSGFTGQVAIMTKQ